jgi:ribonuclease HIII
LKLDPKHESRLRQILEREGFDFLENEHAFWRAKRGSANVIFYHSGSLLVQGSSADKQRLEELLAPDAGTDARTLGMDESGKGDYFGPLVLAAVLVGPGALTAFRKLGVRDSKTLTDETIARIAPEIVKLARVETRVYEPSEYNEVYDRYGNLNLLMRDGYIELIRRFPANDYDKAILDKFSQSAAQNREISNAALNPLTITERAESDPAVAAASVVARWKFASWMSETSAKLGVPLPKGSGPAARQLFVRFRRDLDEVKFRSVAKAHFKA